MDYAEPEDSTAEPTEIPPESSNSGGVIETNLKKKNNNKKKKKKESITEDPFDSSSSSCSFPHSANQRGIRVSNVRRNPRVMIGSPRYKSDNVETIALPLGMSIAAVLAQVLEKKVAAEEKMSVERLSEIYTLAIRESLANVFGDPFESFVRNFERSFRSTLMTLRLIDESSTNNGIQQSRSAGRTSVSEVSAPLTSHRLENLTTNNGIQPSRSAARPSVSEVSAPLTSHRLENLTCNPDFSEFQSESFANQQSNQEERSDATCLESIGRQLTLYDSQVTQQLISSSAEINQSVSSILERSLMETARSNDLKRFEIGLAVRKCLLKEKQLALSSDANLLERKKLSFGFSKMLFKAEKFKNQVEDTRHTELLKRCMDFLLAGLVIMLGCLGYGTYVFSYERITEAIESCSPATAHKSWWMPKPMSSISSVAQIFWCYLQVGTRMVFGVLMLLTAVFLVMRRTSLNQTMPITIILLLLGVGCGYAGKFCVDTLGGSGYHWVIYWEALCMLHLFSNLFISKLFLILHGPIMVSGKSPTGSVFPYWLRKYVFYALLAFLPVLCGLVPFAGPGEWKDHFSSLVLDNFVRQVE